MKPWSMKRDELDAAHSAFKAAAAGSPPGETRLEYARAMKALRIALAAHRDEVNDVTMAYALRDEVGNMVPLLDTEGKAVPGRVQVANGPQYLEKLAELGTATVSISLPDITDAKLVALDCDEESLATLLDFVDPE